MLLKLANQTWLALENEEIYLRGFTSGKLKRGMFWGYGIYATNKRIIGIKSRKGMLAGALIGGVIGGAVGAVVAGQLGKKLTGDENAKMIKELEEKKDFEISKVQVSQIEVKKPNMWQVRLIGSGRGHLLIVPKSGEQIKILIQGNKEFEQSRDLMQAFFPEAVKLVS